MEDAMRAAILHAAMIVTALTAGGMGAAAQADGISDGTVRIGGEVATGKTATNIDLLAARRVQLRINRALTERNRSGL